MNLREIIAAVGIPVIDLAHQAQVSDYRMYRFLKGFGTLKESEEKAIVETLLAHGAKVEQALAILRQAAHA